MTDDAVPRARYGEAFWRAHHEAWKRSDLNQREYCEAQGLSLKAFGNWRAKFKAEPQQPARKLLYRRGGASHTLGHSLSHTRSHVTYSSFESSPGPIVPPARAGHRRRFSEADRRHILAEAGEPGASISEVARRYGIARRVLCRWRQEQAAAASPSFVDVEIVDAPGGYPVAIRERRLSAIHDQGLRANNRAENSHQPVRRRERKQQRFKSPGSAQRFLSIHAAVQNAFYVQRHLLPRRIFKDFRAETFAVWKQSCIAA